MANNQLNQDPSPFTLDALRLLSLPEDYRFTDEEQEHLCTFLERAKGNAELNQALKRLLLRDLTPLSIKADIVKKMIRFTDKTKYPDVFASAFTKLSKITQEVSHEK